VGGSLCSCPPCFFAVGNFEGLCSKSSSICEQSLLPHFPSNRHPRKETPSIPPTQTTSTMATDLEQAMCSPIYHAVLLLQSKQIGHPLSRSTKKGKNEDDLPNCHFCPRLKSMRALLSTTCTLPIHVAYRTQYVLTNFHPPPPFFLRFLFLFLQCPIQTDDAVSLRPHSHNPPIRYHHRQNSSNRLPHLRRH